MLLLVRAKNLYSNFASPTKTLEMNHNIFLKSQKIHKGRYSHYLFIVIIKDPCMHLTKPNLHHAYINENQKLILFLFLLLAH